MENSTVDTVIQYANGFMFSWYDYAIFFAMLGVSALIGIYFGCFGSKQSTTGEYLLGGKTMKVVPVVVSLVSSHVSGITLLGVPSDVYLNGAAYWLMAPSLILVSIAMMYIYLPVFSNLQITSTYEYLELRFDSTTRKFASMMFALSQVFFLPIVIYIPALAFSAATGIDVHYITPTICGVCIFYTTIGGLKAVVWTDTLQFTITLGAVITVFFLGVNSVGGFDVIWSKAVESGRLSSIVDFDPNPFKRDSFWIVFIGSAAHWTALTGSNQGCVQKFLSLPTLKDGFRAVWLYAFGVALLKTLSVLSGLIIYAKYADCDPFTTEKVHRRDQLLPYYVMEVGGRIPGLPGLFIAGVVSAALSTLSAHLNCLAGTVYEDFVLKFMPKNATEKTASNVLKLIVIISGVIFTLLVYVVEQLGGIFPLALAFASVTSGPVWALFTLGMMFPKVHAKGALWGAIVAELFMSVLIFVTQYYKYIGAVRYDHYPISTDGCNYQFNMTILTTTPAPSATPPEKPLPIFQISHYSYTILGGVITIVLGVLISKFTGSKASPPVRRELLSPLVHKYVPEDSKSPPVEYNSVDKALHLTISNSAQDKEINGCN